VSGRDQLEESGFSVCQKVVERENAPPVSSTPALDRSSLTRIPRIHFVKVSRAQVPSQPPSVYCRSPNLA
jgi:hypothetical protein